MRSVEWKAISSYYTPIHIIFLIIFILYSADEIIIIVTFEDLRILILILLDLNI